MIKNKIIIKHDLIQPCTRAAHVLLMQAVRSAGYRTLTPEIYPTIIHIIIITHYYSVVLSIESDKFPLMQCGWGGEALRDLQDVHRLWLC